MATLNRKESGFSEPIKARKSWLLPRPALKIINDDYRNGWSPNSERSIETGESFTDRKRTMWIRESGMQKQVMDLLSQRIEAVVKQGDVFRIMEVGSASYASLFTGLSYETIETQKGKRQLQPKGVLKRGQGLEDVLEQWGYKAGKDFEMIAVHGGDFVIPERTGLKLITANIFGRIPVQAQSVDLLLSFNTVYQLFGGFYLLEYFDRFLKRSQDRLKRGMAVVWPFEDGGNRIILIDGNQRPLSFESVFKNLQTNVDYWDTGRHVAWISDKSRDLRFPIKPIALIIQSPHLQNMVYQIETDSTAGKGKRVVYHDNPDILENTLSSAEKVIYF